MAYFPEAAAVLTFDLLQLLEEEENMSSCWWWFGGMGGSYQSDSWKRLICPSGVFFFYLRGHICLLDFIN